MKTRMTHMLAAFTLALAGNAHAAVNWKPVVIEFSVNPGQNELMAHSNNQGCTRGQGARKGCVKFGLDEIGQVVFGLVGTPKTNKCTDPGTQYVITQVELSHEGFLRPSAGGPVLADKGIFDQPVPPWLQQAFPGTGQDGVVYSASQEEASNRAVVINLNNQPNAAGGNEKDVWYRVTVTRCSDGTTLQSDPRIENDGSTN